MVKRGFCEWLSTIENKEEKALTKIMRMKYFEPYFLRDCLKNRCSYNREGFKKWIIDNYGNGKFYLPFAELKALRKYNKFCKLIKSNG